MTTFRRVAVPPGEHGTPAGGPGYRLAARFGATEAMLLRELALQVVGLITGESGPAPGASGASGGGAPGAGGFAWPGQEGDNGLLRELEESLGPSRPAAPPDDPALARLLPDAYRDDPDAASEFRRYTEDDLRAGKVAAAETVLATLPEGGGRISLSAEQGEIWLRSLNDIRLALGVRLGITEDMGAEPPQVGPADPRYAVFALYDWLTGVQDSLVRAMW